MLTYDNPIANLQNELIDPSLVTAHHLLVAASIRHGKRSRNTANGIPVAAPSSPTYQYHIDTTASQIRENKKITAPEAIYMRGARGKFDFLGLHVFAI